MMNYATCRYCGYRIDRGRKVISTFLYPRELMELHEEECREGQR